MKRVGLFVVVAVLVANCYGQDAGSTDPDPTDNNSTPPTETIQPTVAPVEYAPAASWTIVPQITLEEVAGSWTETTVLEIREDGSYELVADFGTDTGNYEVRDNGVARFTSAGGEECELGDIWRVYPIMAEDPSLGPTVLTFDLGVNQCGTLRDLPIYLIRQDEGEGLIGIWHREVTFTINTDNTYKLTSLFGSEAGAFDYDPWPVPSFDLHPVDGGICDLDSHEVNGSYERWVYEDDKMGIHFRAEEECELLSPLNGWYVREDI